MKDSEKNMTASERKKKIRERYRGVDLEEINIIPYHFSLDITPLDFI